MSWSHEDKHQAPTAALLIKRGQAAAHAGKKAEARHFFQIALEMVPDHPDALLWLAYLAGGGRPSLVYLVRLLEADPTNQRARTAIRWARKHAKPQEAEPITTPVANALGQSQRRLSTLVGLMVLVGVLFGGLLTAGFALALPTATPTQAPLITTLTSANLLPSDTPPSTFTATPTELPSPTASIPPSPMPTVTLTPSPSPSPTPPPTVTAILAAILPTASPTPLPTIPVGDNFRWIDVDLTHQRLIAYEGQTPMRTVIVSTGLPRTPTVTGRFKIYVKHKKANMSGPGYNLQNVPYVMYFYGGYGLHGTYWHSNFGQPMSHGCVNLPTPEAEWLYNWASVGTLVVVHQ